MKRKPYKRKPGDFEIRILSNGTVIMIAPDEALTELARSLSCQTGNRKQDLENLKNGKTKADKSHPTSCC
jgi:hypothetical protein